MIVNLVVSFNCPKCNKECKEPFHEACSIDVSAHRTCGDYFGQVDKAYVFCSNCREETEINHGYQ